MVREQRVTFECAGDTIVGTLFRPEGDGRRGGLVVDGPMTSVKEQASGNYARALAGRGLVTLAIDHRHFGESGGQPRQYEHPGRKIEDLRAAVGWLGARDDVDPGKVGMVGVCAGAGYAAGAVAGDDRVRAFGTVAGFFHDATQQRA